MLVWLDSIERRIFTIWLEEHPRAIGRFFCLDTTNASHLDTIVGVRHSLQSDNPEITYYCLVGPKAYSKSLDANSFS